MKSKKLTPYQECLRDILLVAIGDRFKDDAERNEMAEQFVGTYGDVLIDHACDWLNANAHRYLVDVKYHGVKMAGLHVSMVEDFKKAMIKGETIKED